MNPTVSAVIEVAKALGIRLGIVFVLVVIWDFEPPGIYPRNTMVAFRFLACFVGAAITYKSKPRAKRKWVIRLFTLLLVTIGTYLVYRYAVTPSKPANSPFFVGIALVMYFASSFCYGFCGGEIASVFEAEAAKTQGSQHAA